MLLQFSCSNFKSIKNKIIFSLLASNDNTMEETLKCFANVRVMRSAVIYGANGSGKTNFLTAILYMQTMVLQSINNQLGQDLMQSPHKTAEQDKPSEFDIQFVKNGVRYAYGFSIENKKFKNEYLYFFPNGRQTKVFERDNMNIKLGNKFKTLFDSSIDMLIGVLKENKLFLSCAANLTNIKELQEAFVFFVNDIVFYNPVINNWTEYSLNLIKNDPKIKNIFLAILQALGTGIKDVHANIELTQIQESDLPKEMPENFKKLFISQQANKIDAKIIYDNFTTDLMFEESAGISNLFKIICPIIDILNNEKILICDEFEQGLHESIVSFIVKLFQNSRKDKFAQIVFSTHNTSLLDTNLFRRDQIWFTELDNERSTDLYSLSEIKNVRKTDNIEKGYILGKYGAIPILNPKFHLDI